LVACIFSNVNSLSSLSFQCASVARIFDNMELLSSYLGCTYFWHCEVSELFIISMCFGNVYDQMCVVRSCTQREVRVELGNRPQNLMLMKARSGCAKSGRWAFVAPGIERIHQQGELDECWVVNESIELI